MADYSIIADVSNHIVKMLREKMCPEPIPSAGNIQVSSPTSQDVDYLLGVYLYDIKENTDVARPDFMKQGRVQLTKPPRPYTLEYMVFVNGGTQMGLEAPDIQKILGKVAQIVSDNSQVPPSQLQPWLEMPEPPIVFSQSKITLEEKVRVWSALQKPYQVSLFYKVAPVFVSSEILVDVPVVTDATFTLETTMERRERAIKNGRDKP